MKLRLFFQEMLKHLLYDYMSPSYRTQKNTELFKSISPIQCIRGDEGPWMNTRDDTFRQVRLDDNQKRVLYMKAKDKRKPFR